MVRACSVDLGCKQFLSVKHGMQAHLCEWLRFTCLLVSLDALHVEFAFSQVLALLNPPNLRLFLSVLVLGAALQSLC